MLNKLMIGRLGNQMFQYATMRAIQLKYYPDEKINLNFRLVYKEGARKDGFVNQLEMFRLSSHGVDGEIRLSLRQKVLFTKYVVGYKILKLKYKGDYEIAKRNYEIKMQDALQKNGLFVFSYGYWGFKKANTKNKLFAGFFESSRYFDDIRGVLLEEFTPKKPRLERNVNLYKEIERSESVCVSIRRGDFLAPEHIKKNYICTPEYFEKAIGEISRRVKNPRLIIFSDDIEWCRGNLEFPEGTLFESGDDPVWEKLRLMYSCKHFIISNSTFSWWAQYLSRNEKKVVIAPHKWKNDGYNDDIYQDGWVLV